MSKPEVHEFNILVHGLYLPDVIYQVEAPDFASAAQGARVQWKNTYGHLGLRATISKVREATARDMKKFIEAKE